MNQRVCEFREKLAEIGVEKTPVEARNILVSFEKLFKVLSLEECLRFKSMTQAEIKKIAKDFNQPFEEVVEIVNFIGYVGHILYGV